MQVPPRTLSRIVLARAVFLRTLSVADSTYQSCLSRWKKKVYKLVSARAIYE